MNWKEIKLKPRESGLFGNVSYGKFDTELEEQLRNLLTNESLKPRSYDGNNLSFDGVCIDFRYTFYEDELVALIEIRSDGIKSGLVYEASMDTDNDTVRLFLERVSSVTENKVASGNKKIISAIKGVMGGGEQKVVSDNFMGNKMHFEDQKKWRYS